MNFLRSRRGLAVVVALLLILFLWRPGVYRLRNRIAGSIGSALGRTVAIDYVRLRLLPRPGFDLEGLVISDDPAFSAEPMMRAQEVSAAIRFRSLLHGRLEIATLSANEPSINLVRNVEGRWNLASLLERNAQIPAAPTAKPASEHRPAFPYLEASNARINFKIGQTKKAYALTDADVSLWQDSDNSWGARIRAAPVRTDFNLTDTGLVQIDAAWQRATSLRVTPVQITAQWQKGQLGQITKLLSGKDRGWRGGVSVTAKLSGTPEALRIESQTVVEDFHRYDIAESENLRLASGCSGQYNAGGGDLSDLRCESTVGGGAVRLRGNLSGRSQSSRYDLTLTVEKMPLASAVRLLHQAKKQTPADLTASGLLNAEFHATRNGPPVRGDARFGLLPQWSGSGSATDVRLSFSGANGTKDEIALGTVPLTLVAADLPLDKRGRRNTPEKYPEPDETHLRIGPATLATNASAPVSVGGWLSRRGYLFYLRGDSEMKNLFRLEDVLGLPVTRPAAEGSAKLDVSVSGLWQGFAATVALGTAQLHNVRAEIRGLNIPLEIGSANVSLTPDTVTVQKISARTGNVHWSGSVVRPRHCGASAVTLNCPFQFDLTADQLSTGDLAEWFTPQSAKRPWYRILNSGEPNGSSPLLAIQAHGNLRVGRFGLKKAFVNQVTSQVDVDRGKIALTGLRGQLLRGTHLGNWVVEVSNSDAKSRDASAHGVHYHGSGTLQDIALDQVGALMNDDWISGNADGKFDWDGSGDTFHALLSGSDGTLQFTMRNGRLPHVEMPGSAEPLAVNRFAGQLRLKKDVWELSDGRLESRDRVYQVSGTASPARGFDFVLKRNDEQTWNLTGTLAKPRLAPVERTVAKRTETADAKTVKP